MDLVRLRLALALLPRRPSRPPWRPSFRPWRPRVRPSRRPRRPRRLRRSFLAASLTAPPWLQFLPPLASDRATLETHLPWPFFCSSSAGSAPVAPLPRIGGRCSGLLRRRGRVLGGRRRCGIDCGAGHQGRRRFHDGIRARAVCDPADISAVVAVIAADARALGGLGHRDRAITIEIDGLLGVGRSGLVGDDGLRVFTRVVDVVAVQVHEGSDHAGRGGPGLGQLARREHGQEEDDHEDPDRVHPGRA